MTSVPHAARGFTLLELLVVMVIIGIIAAMMTLSVGVATPDTSVTREMERIENLLKLASEEAVLSGRELGLTFYDKEYEFSTLDPDSIRWQPIVNDEPFTPRKFPPESLVDLTVEGRSVRLALEKPPPPPQEKKPEAEAENDDETIAGEGDGEAAKDGDPKDEKKKAASEPDPRVPQILILSSGDIMPAFELRLRPGIGGRGTRLRVLENGRIERLNDEA